jgi:integrase
MPSLWKRKNSPYWYACWTNAGGQRLKKSTELEDRKEAWAACVALQQAEDLAAKGTLTEARARELIAEIVERTSGNPLATYTAEDWLRQWLRGKEVARSKGTLLKYTHTVESFLTHLGERAKLNVAAITSRDGATFRDAELKAGKHPNTVKFTVKHLRIPFNAARRAGLITVNPAEAVELPENAKTEDGAENTRDAFNIKQVEALLAVAEGDWRGLILIGFFTGMRLSDAAKLTWNAIDLPAKKITYTAKKTSQRIVIPMHPALEAYLLELPAPDTGKAHLFASLADKETRGRSGLSMTFARIMAQAKVEGAILTAVKEGSKGRTRRSLSYHSLRHSFNSLLANEGVSQELRMKLTGHTREEQNADYTHLQDGPLRGAIGKLPSPTLTRKAAAI